MSLSNILQRRLSMEDKTLGHDRISPDITARYSFPISRTSFSDSDDDRNDTPSGRKMSFVGDSEDFQLMQLAQEEALIPLKEDVSDWLTSLLEVDVNVNNFMEVLDNGVILCKLGRYYQQKAEEAVRLGSETQKLPPTKICCKQNARSGTWFARDNIANFLTWCRNLNIKDEYMFETEGLVTHKQCRNVVLCLLELARIGTKYGIQSPGLIQLEKEIENEENGGIVKLPRSPSSGNGSSPGSLQSTPNASPKPSPKKTSSPRRLSPGPKRATNKNRKRSTSSSSSQRSSTDDLDRQVRRIYGVCNCTECYQVERISEGKYVLGGKIVFVRLLKGKHVMVRVGGGWDTLDHYVQTHDPCKMVHIRRTKHSVSVIENGKSDNEAYLHMKARYCNQRSNSNLT